MSADRFYKLVCHFVTASHSRRYGTHEILHAAAVYRTHKKAGHSEQTNIQTVRSDTDNHFTPTWAGNCRRNSALLRVRCWYQILNSLKTPTTRLHETDVLQVDLRCQYATEHTEKGSEEYTLPKKVRIHAHSPHTMRGHDIFMCLIFNALKASVPGGLPDDGFWNESANLG